MLDEAFRLALQGKPLLSAVPFETGETDLPDPLPAARGAITVDSVSYTEERAMGRRLMHWRSTVWISLVHDDRRTRQRMTVAARSLTAQEVMQHIDVDGQELVGALDLAETPATAVLDRGLPDESALVAFVVVSTRDPESG